MVSFWPFKGDENSAASFEKLLSQLSTKISKVSAENDRHRLRRRKYKVLWSLYAVFGYILLAAIFILVIRFENWTAVEYTVIAGGLPFIYAIRSALDSYFAYRVANSRNHLNDLIKQREAAIERLKTATKYNSTQQLLEKYGGSPNNAQQQKDQQNKKPAQQQLRKRASDIGQSTQSAKHFGRTGFAPPPTANIQPNKPPQPQPPSSKRPHSSAGFPTRSFGTPPPPEDSGILPAPGEEFAPNAFTQTQPPPINRQPSQYATEGPKWYDRILDVMLGEDEGHAKNRVVLICEQCRLVNGQAPPGIRSLQEIGRWRCGGCHAWNGVENEEKKMLKQISQTDNFPTAQESTSTAPSPTSISKAIDEGYEHIKHEIEEEDEDAEVESPEEQDVSDAPPASSTRSKVRQRTQT